MSSAMSRLIILSLLGSIAKSFLITETVELILGWLLGVRTRKGMLLVFLANLMTNPAAVLIFSFVGILAGNKAAAVIIAAVERDDYNNYRRYYNDRGNGDRQNLGNNRLFWRLRRHAVRVGIIRIRIV